MTDLAADAARKTLAENNEARGKSDSERAKMTKGVPTPSQEENDLASLGAPVKEKADDGSGPDRFVEADKKRNEEAEKRRKEAQADRPAAGGYQTRQSAATPPPKK